MTVTMSTGDEISETVQGYEDISLGVGTRDAKLVWAEHKKLLGGLIFVLIAWPSLVTLCGWSFNFPILGPSYAFMGVPFSFFFSLTAFAPFLWFLFYFIGGTSDAPLSQMATCFFLGVLGSYLAFALEVIIQLIIWTLCSSVFYLLTMSIGESTLYFAAILNIICTVFVDTPLQILSFYLLLKRVPHHSLTNRFTGALYGLSFGVGFSITVALPAISICGAIYSSVIALVWEQFLLNMIFVFIDYSFFATAINVFTGVWIGWSLNYNKFNNSPGQTLPGLNLAKWQLQILPVFIVRVLYLLVSAIPTWIVEYIEYLGVSIFINTVTAALSGTSIEFYKLYAYSNLWPISFSVGVIAVIFTVCLILYIRKVSLSFYSAVASSGPAETMYDDL